MGLSDLFQTAQTAQTAPGAPSLKELIIGGYGRREVVPPQDPSFPYLRASGLASVCPRREVLCTRLVRPRLRVHDADEIANYDVGSGMHWAMQNLILPALGILRGAWLCLSCCRTHGAWTGEGYPHKAAIARPGSCPACGGGEFLYREYMVSSPVYGTGGHMDGILVLPGSADPGLFELKSISQAGSRLVKDVPKADHVLQAQAYMWMAGLRWAKILYWVKGVYSLEKNLIEHHVDASQEAVDRLKEMLSSVQAGFPEGSPLPDRVCVHRGCTQAQECPVLTECFGDPEPDEAAGLI